VISRRMAGFYSGLEGAIRTTANNICKRPFPYYHQAMPRPSSARSMRLVEKNF
jgi:hypothetical protein